MYSDEVMQAIRQKLGLYEDDTSRDAYINNLPLRKVLDLYLSWEGVNGYTDIILGIFNKRAEMLGVRDPQF